MAEGKGVSEMSAQPRKSNPKAKTHTLVRYDEMCRAIAEVYRVDEVKDIRDKAMAIMLYAKQANNREAELQAIQIRVRAERKAGELLREIPTAQGHRTDLAPPRDEVPSPKHEVLSDLNISRQQASDWERLADVPEAEFEKHLTTSEAPSARGIVYDHVRLHGDRERSAPEKLTVDDMTNALLEGAIRDIERLENKYDNIGLVKNALATARQTLAVHLVPAPCKKGGGIHIVK
jgi:hypothetical protein